MVYILTNFSFRERSRQESGRSCMPRKTKAPKDAMPETVREFKPLFYRKLMETHLFYEVGKTIASELEPYDLVQKVITRGRESDQL